MYFSGGSKELLVSSFIRFGMCFRASHSSVDFLTVAAGRIDGFFNLVGPDRVVILTISETFERVVRTGLLHSFKFDETLGLVLNVISSFL